MRGGGKTEEGQTEGQTKVNVARCVSVLVIEQGEQWGGTR